MKISLLKRLAFNIDDQGQFIYLTPKRNLWFWLWVIYQFISARWKMEIKEFEQREEISEEQALND